MKRTDSASTPASPSEFPRPPEAGDLTPALRVLLAGGTLDAEQTTTAFETIMTGAAHHGEIGALLALLATRIPTADEILGPLMGSSLTTSAPWSAIICVSRGPGRKSDRSRTRIPSNFIVSLPLSNSFHKLPHLHRISFHQLLGDDDALHFVGAFTDTH